MEAKRLNKFISDSGFCSRREADRLIVEERVTVNGKLATAGVKVTPKDKVRIDDQLLNVREEAPVFLMFNKPANMSANSDPSVRDNVVRAINYPASIQPIGHLERDSDGLLFLSNDADLVRKMTRADNKFEKEYIVTVDKLLASDFIAKMSSGGALEGSNSQPKNQITKEGSARFRIVLQAGTNHNIKRMCESLGYKVMHLQRVRIQNLSIAKLPTGVWRKLSEQEVAQLVQIANARAGKGKAFDYSEEEAFGGERSPRNRSSSYGKPGRGAAGSGKTARTPTAGKHAKARAAGGKGAGPKAGAGKQATGKKGRKGSSENSPKANSRRPR